MRTLVLVLAQEDLALEVLKHGGADTAEEPAGTWCWRGAHGIGPTPSRVPISESTAGTRPHGLAGLRASGSRHRRSPFGPVGRPRSRAAHAPGLSAARPSCRGAVASAGGRARWSRPWVRRGLSCRMRPCAGDLAYTIQVLAPRAGFGLVRRALESIGLIGHHRQERARCISVSALARLASLDAVDARVPDLQGQVVSHVLHASPRPGEPRAPRLSSLPAAHR